VTCQTAFVTDPATLLEALRAVPGVASADLEPDDRPEGAGTLRLQLSPGADEVQVATSVNRVLREQFGLAVDANRVQVVEEAEPLRREAEPLPAPPLVGDWSQQAVAPPAPQVPEAEDAAESPLPPPTPIRKGLVAVPEPPAAPVTEPTSAWEQVRASLDEAVTEADALAAHPVPASPTTPTPVPTNGPVLVPPSVTGSTMAVESTLGTFGHEGEESADFPPRPPRVLIQRMQLVSAGLGVTTEVTLSWQGLPFSGAADAAATPTSVHRSVAMATLRAVEAVVSGRARFELEQLEVNQLGPDRAVVVVVSMLTKAGSERLTGVSVVREDVRQAVIRATLDALNRRLESILFA
jgi:hypothetical protein